jgi:ankyrin repeat protein
MEYLDTNIPRPLRIASNVLTIGSQDAYYIPHADVKRLGLGVICNNCTPNGDEDCQDVLTSQFLQNVPYVIKTEIDSQCHDATGFPPKKHKHPYMRATLKEPKIDVKLFEIIDRGGEPLEAYLLNTSFDDVNAFTKTIKQLLNYCIKSKDLRQVVRLYTTLLLSDNCRNKFFDNTDHGTGQFKVFVGMLMAARINLNYHVSGGMTLLGHAAKNINPELVMFMLKGKADINALYTVDPTGVVIRSVLYHTVEQYITVKRTVNFNPNHMTKMLLIIKTLVRFNADLNMFDGTSFKKNALSLAVENWCEELIDMLLPLRDESLKQKTTLNTMHLAYFHNENELDGMNKLQENEYITEGLRRIEQFMEKGERLTPSFFDFVIRRPTGASLLIQRLIKYGANVNLPNTKGLSPLGAAVMSNSPENVMTLIPLINTSVTNDINTLWLTQNKQAIREETIFISYQYGYTPLMAACSEHNGYMIQLLFTTPSDNYLLEKDKVSYYGNTALMILLLTPWDDIIRSRGTNAQMKLFQQDAGERMANALNRLFHHTLPNVEDLGRTYETFGCSTLNLAVLHDNANCLIDEFKTVPADVMKAVVNKTTLQPFTQNKDKATYGMTPLMTASKYHRHAWVTELVKPKFATDVQAVSIGAGMSALMYAIRQPPINNVECIRDRELTIEKLLALGVHTEIKCFDTEETALHIATKVNDVKTIILLLKNGASRTVKNSEGLTPYAAHMLLDEWDRLDDIITLLQVTLPVYPTIVHMDLTYE